MTVIVPPAIPSSAEKPPRNETRPARANPTGISLCFIAVWSNILGKRK